VAAPERFSFFLLDPLEPSHEDAFRPLLVAVGRPSASSPPPRRAGDLRARAEPHVRDLRDRHFNTSTNRGRFDKKEGTVTIDRAAKTGKLDVTLDTTSLNTGVAQFTKHLSSDEILDVAKFPTAEFHGDKFTFSGDKVTEIAGNLTLHGKTNPITLRP
jgi:polyisoprenoid-binding protein YceI